MRKYLVVAAVLSVAAVTTAGCAGSPPDGRTPSTVSVQGRPSPDVPSSPPAAPVSPPAVAVVSAPPVVDGKAPVIRQIQTDKPYVFITMDDGAVLDPQAQRMIKDSGARPALFLNQKYFKENPDYFRALQAAGAEINDHTLNHPNLRGKPYEFQRGEICGDADAIQATFGKRPTLFRPPFGNYDENTRKAVADCGMKAVVLWTAAVNDGVVQFQKGDRLNAGDIVLMHFRHTFAADFQAFLDRAKKDGLTVVPLTDFLA
ncbi:MAG: polysaccharide deacetylase family protein [Kibdelosporangium sp.]